MLGNRAFVLYTIDKVIAQTVKCLHALANDEIVSKLVGLFVYHRSNRRHEYFPTSTSSTTTTTTTTMATQDNHIKCHDVDSEFYLNHVNAILAQTMEDVYRLQVLTCSDFTSPTVEIACQFIGPSGQGNRIIILNQINYSYLSL